MGLFSWLFGGKSASARSRPIADLTNGPGTYRVEVVGESHYQGMLEMICGGRTAQSQRFEVEAFLVPEDENPYDPKAVAIRIQEQRVGHLDRGTARIYRRQMAKIGAKGAIGKCRAIIVGGWDRGDGNRGHFGVKLDLPTG